MKRIGILSAAFAGMLAVACGGNDRRNEAPAPASDTAAVGTAGSEANREVNNSAKNWLEDRMKDNMAEVKLGDVVAKRAMNADVKAYGKLMVQDHEKANAELKQIASKHHIEPPIDVGPDHAKVADELSEKKGADFDKAYIDSMIDDHQNVLEALEDRLVKSGDDKNPTYTPKKTDNAFDTELNQWAANSAPVVRGHLDKAKELKNRLDRRATH
jgi:putative membrane protein